MEGGGNLVGERGLSCGRGTGAVDLSNWVPKGKVKRGTMLSGAIEQGTLPKKAKGHSSRTAS